MSQSATGNNLARSLIEVMEECGVLQKVYQKITDNANNIKNAVHLTKKAWQPCFAHLLNLVVKHTLEHFDGKDGRLPLLQARKSVKEIVKVFSYSAKATRLLEVRYNLSFTQTMCV